MTGVATGDLGVGRDGKPKGEFVRGMALHGKYTLFAEGARGSLTKKLIGIFDLDVDAEPQKFGIGLKELWQVQPEKHQPGLVQHTLGWPLDNRTGGGSFMYHYGENLVSIGLRRSPQLPEPLSPSLQGVPAFQDAPGHRARPGGRQAHRLRRARAHRGRLAVDPEAHLPRRRADRLRRGLHERAAHQGLAQRHAVGQARGRGGLRGHRSGPWRRRAYAFTSRPSGLAPSRTISSGSATPSRFCRGSARRLEPCFSGMDMWLNTISTKLTPTFKHGKPDYAALKPAKNFKPIDYPKPDGKLTFDIPSSLFLSGTNHEEDQPVHL